MIDLVIFLPLLTLGLVSGAHCIGMCGGIMGALTMAIPADATSRRWLILIAYNLGRIASYAAMGLLAGFFSEQFAALGGGIILRVMAGILLIVMGLYLADWWRGLTKLETVGRYFWVYLQPLGRGLMPVDNTAKALLLGALWGWLPCGLVYAALAMAMTQPAPLLAAGAMLAFGLGTLPAVLAAGVVAQQLTAVLQHRKVRVGMALIIIIFGAWTIWGSLGHDHNHMSGHTHEHHEGHPNHEPALPSRDHDATQTVGQTDHSSMHHDMEMSHQESESAVTDHAMMDHSHHMSVSTLERQRTDDGTKLEDDKKSASSSVQASETHMGDHHHEQTNP